MHVTRWKRIFVYAGCMLLLGFVWIRNGIWTVERLPWPGQTDGQFVDPVSTVALLQSEKARAEDITLDEIRDLVGRAIDLAGGLESIVSNGDSVILKPNLVGSGGQRPDVNGVTTDVRVVRAVSERVRALNPDGWIGVLEGSAPGDNQRTRDMFDLYAYNAASLPDVDAIIALEDVDGSDKDYNSKDLVSVELPDSVSLYPDLKKPNFTRHIFLAKLYARADAVISIPVLKNHESAALTVGIKNTGIGMTPPSIYRKELYNIPNLRFEIDHSYPNMHKWIHDFFMCRPTNFVVVDALQGLQHGPGGGSDPARNRMNMRLILAGRDLVAVDAVSAHLIGLDPAGINYLTYLHNDRAGCADHTRIRVKGNVRVSDVKKKFAHSDPRTIAVMVSDFRAPDLSIRSMEVTGNTLLLSLDTSDETELVEISVDGERLERNVVSNYEAIPLDWTGRSATGHEIEVTAYDAYRNAATATAIVTSVSSPTAQYPRNTDLLPNTPNPFNPETTLRFVLQERAHVTLSVYSLRGRMLARLADQDYAAGTHQVRWNGKDNLGRPAASGTYLVRLETVSGSIRTNRNRKITLIR